RGCRPPTRALFRALNVYLDVPSELLVYPGEGHGLSKWSHRKAKLAWDIAWFDHHVLGIEPGSEDDAAE
ncbi:MAG: dipeptidyl aminopeptidase/acylaminoacyl peptidase, partial [Myxococcota bacterium]